MLKILQNFIINTASADVTGSGGTFVQIKNPLGNASLQQVIDRITSYAIGIGASLSTIMVLVGAFQILTAGGDASKFEKGKKTVLYAAIGFGVLLLASGLAGLIADILGKTTS